MRFCVGAVSECHNCLDMGFCGGSMALRKGGLGYEVYSEDYSTFEGYTGCDS